jgi:RNA polymerase sigma-70 factor (ECF subfamily)
MAEAVGWDLVREAAEGDAFARRRLVEATMDGVWTLAMRMLRRADEADDVVQETYARALAALPHLVPDGRFEGYLARVATNLVLERWRRRPAGAAAAQTIAAPAALEPWRAVADREDEQRRLAAVWEGTQRLAPGPRAALLLFYAQDFSCDQIAQVLDAPVGTVKTWLHRARADVRRTAEALLDGRGRRTSAKGADEP